MPTVVTKTIIAGGGGDYTSWASWIADCAATYTSGLVAADVVWKGVGSGAFSSASNILTVTGITQDATRYVWATGATLTIGSGARFNSANGVAITCTGDYVYPIKNSSSGTRFTNLQVYGSSTSAFGARPCIYDDVGAAGLLRIDQCIIETEKAGVVDIYGSSQYLTNSLCVQRGSGRASIASIKNGSHAINVTFVVPSDKTAATVALIGQYGSAEVKNCGIFNFAALSSGTAPTYTTSKTDLGSPPSGMSQVTYNTSLFTNITDSTRDFSLPSGSALIAAGTTDATYAPTDLIGNTRTANDIGALQYVAASGNNTLISPLPSKQLIALNPTFRQPHTLVVPLASKQLVALNPVFRQNHTLVAPLPSVKLTALLPTFRQNHTLVAPLPSKQLVALNPTFVQSNHISMAAPLPSINLTALNPTFAQSGPQSMVITGLPGVTLTALAPSFVQTGPNVLSAPLASLGLLALAPSFVQTSPAPPAAEVPPREIVKGGYASVNQRTEVYAWREDHSNRITQVDKPEDDIKSIDAQDAEDLAYIVGKFAEIMT